MSTEIPCVVGIHSLTSSLYLDSQVSSLKNENDGFPCKLQWVQFFFNELSLCQHQKASISITLTLTMGDTDSTICIRSD